MKRIVLHEWLFTISEPARGRHRRIRVTVENADGADRQFGRALAKVIEAWHAARGGRP